MRGIRRHSFWRSLRRRLGAGLTLLAYVLTAFGLPLPAGTAASCGCVADECRTGKCCCAPEHEGPAPCCTGKPGCTMPCCRQGAPSESCPSEDDAPPADDETPAEGVTWVIGISAMKCRGHSTLWVSAGIVLPPPMPTVIRPALAAAGWLSISAEHAAAALLLPPEPPPRSVTA